MSHVRGRLANPLAGDSWRVVPLIDPQRLPLGIEMPRYVCKRSKSNDSVTLILESSLLVSV